MTITTLLAALLTILKEKEVFTTEEFNEVCQRIESENKEDEEV